MRLLHEIAIFQTVKSKVIISLFETVRLSVSISLRNLYNSLNSIKEMYFSGGPSPFKMESSILRKELCSKGAEKHRGVAIHLNLALGSIIGLYKIQSLLPDYSDVV